MNNTLVWLLQFILERHYWYDNYYLRSKHWRKIRAVKIQREKRRCYRCGKIVPTNQVINVHHKEYYRNGESILWHEKNSELQVLHEACHNLQHSKG